MNTTSNRITRTWHAVFPRRGSVARPSDRVQAGLAVLVFLLALVSLPFATSLGSEIYVNQQKQSAEETSTRSPATAMLLEDGPPVSASGRGSATGEAGPTDANWVVDGTTHVGKVTAQAGTAKGQVVPIWLDRGGNPVAPPLSSAAAVIDAVCIALGLWAGSLLLLALLYLGVVYALDRRRHGQWDREWLLEQQLRK